MLSFLAIIALIVLGLLIWFQIPYSPTKSEFRRLTRHQLTKTPAQNGIFTPEDIAELPLPVKKYFQYCGYIGTPKMSNMKIEYNDVDFVLSGFKEKFKIKYIQYNSIAEPERIAYIRTSLFGLPFEGIDAYQNGAGSMQGIVAKNSTMFNQKGAAMNRAGLVTCLAESLLLPNLALQNYISWEEIDETHAQAVISYYGISASGIFTFDENGAMTSFTTDDREYVTPKGKPQKVKWSAVCEDYQEVDGIKYPAALKAVWHFPTRDLVYFDGRGIDINYNVAH